MKTFSFIAALVLVHGFSPLLEAARQLADQGETVITPEAWNWNLAPWDSEKVVTWNDHQYVVFWDSGGYLALARRNLMDETIQQVRFTDARMSRDNPHHSTSIGISPEDGRLHIAYDHWATPLRYRRSVAGFISSPPANLATSQFEGAQAMVGSNESQVTYPRFFNLKDGRLLFLYRGDGGSSNADHFLNRYDGATGTWSRVGMLFSRAGSYSEPGFATSYSRSAYPNTIVVDGSGRIHITWTFREGAGHQTNHDLYYATSDDGGLTWQNNSGATVADLPGGKAIGVHSTGIRVVRIPYNSWLINQDAMVVDGEGQPHVVTQISSVVTSETSQRNIHYIHYWRTAGGEWRNEWVDDVRITRSGIRPRGDLAIDSDDNLHFFAVESGIFKYWMSRASEDWSDWTGRNLFNGYSGEGIRYDRRLWENNDVLSVPLVHPATNGFHIRTLTLSPPGPEQDLGSFEDPGHLEGWRLVKHLAGSVEGGSLHLEFQGNDPYLRKTGLFHDTSSYSYLKVRMRNRSPATEAAIFFITDSDGTWNYQKAKRFAIRPHDEEYRTYVIDLTDRPGWQGFVTGIRLDPSEGTETTGRAEIDSISLSTSPDVHPTVSIRPKSDRLAFEVTRVEGSGDSLSVRLEPSGTAEPGLHYEPLPETLLLEAGEDVAELEVLLRDDALFSEELTVELELLEDAAYRRGESPRATLILPARPIDVWRRASFNEEELADPGISGDLADASGDGLPNLLTYVLGLDPRVPYGGDSIPRAEMKEGQVELRFRRSTSTPDAALTVEQSDDLVQWIPAEGTIEQVDSGESSEIVVYRPDSAPGMPREFYRLRATRQ